MNTVILLCATMLAAENPGHVQAKIVFGDAVEQNQQAADIDSWISRAAAKAGSPLALPRSGWISLTDKHKRLYTSEKGGFIIGGRTTPLGAKYKVEIDACAGVGFDKTVFLRPGERRVVNLTEEPAPKTVFIALEAPLSERAKKLAAVMKRHAKTFQLSLDYNGPERKPYYRLTASVPVVNRRRNSPFNQISQLSEDEAKRVIDHLASEGFLDHAVDLRTKIKIPPPSMPGYTMKVVTGDMHLYQDLGWDLSMIERLGNLRMALPDTGRAKMDFLLGRLSGWRKRWESEAVENKRTSPKGWELYVWKDGKKTYYSLMIGTNRAKSDDNIAAAAVNDFAALKTQLKQLRKGELVYLFGRRLSADPPEDKADLVAEYGDGLGLQMDL